MGCGRILAAVIVAVCVASCDRDPVDAAISDLEGFLSSSADRALAAERLGGMPDPRALAALLRALDREEPEVRRASARALGRLGEGAAVAPLAARLSGDWPEADKDLVVEALGAIGDPRAVPDIAARLDAPAGPGIAASALARLGGPGAAALVQRARDTGRVGEGAMAALQGIGDPRAVDLLIGLTDDDDDRLRAVAAEALGGIGDRRAVPALIAALRGCVEPGIPVRSTTWRTTSHSPVRAAAATALGRIGDGRATDPLREALRRCPPDVRVAAAGAVADLGLTDDPTIDLVYEALIGVPGAERNRAIARALVRMGGRGPALLAESATGVSSYTFTGPSEALVAEIDRPEVRRALLEVLDHDDPLVRSFAADLIRTHAIEVPAERRASLLLAAQDWEGLAGLGGDAIAILIHRIAWRPEVSRTLEGFGPEAVGPLAEAFSGLPPRGRELAAGVLGTIGDARAAPVLDKALHYDPDDGVFQAAATALAGLGVPGLQRLGRAVNAIEDPDRRDYLFALLGNLGKEEAVPFLAQALRLDGGGVAGALAALGRLGPAARQAVPLIVERIDAGGPAWGEAIAVLGRIGGPQAEAFLVAGLSDWRRAPAAVAALDGAGWRPASPRDDVLAMAGRRDRLALLAGWSKSLDVLRSELASESEATVDNAARVLVGLGRSEAVPLLLALLDRRGGDALAGLFAHSGLADLETAGQAWWTRNHSGKMAAVGEEVHWGHL